MDLMKETLSILFIAIFLSACSSHTTNDCAERVIGELITDFHVSSANLQDGRFNKYLSDEERYYGKLLELQTKQEGDSLLVDYFILGGNSTLNCVELRRTKKRIDIINYESNYLKETPLEKLNTVF